MVIATVLTFPRYREEVATVKVIATIMPHRSVVGMKEVACVAVKEAGPCRFVRPPWMRRKRL